MRKPVLANSLCVLVYLIISITSKAQSKSSIFKSNLVPEIEMGAALPAGTDVKQVFNIGFSTSLGAKVAVLNERLFLKPIGGIKWYQKGIEKENQLTEHLRTWKAGLELQYRLLDKSHFGLSPLLRLEHNWSANYFSETYYYGSGPNNYEIAKSDKFFKGTGFSTDLGLLAQYKDWYLKLNYESYQPALTINDKIRQEGANQGFIINPTQKFNFNSINISIGTRLIFTR